MQMKGAHAPRASYNTPSIELNQYGHRIGKNVHCDIGVSSTFFWGDVVFVIFFVVWC